MQSRKQTKKFISIFALLLSVVMLLTSINIQTLTVHAIDGENGNLTSIVGPVKTFPLGFSNRHQGYRFYVIDNQGNCVSKVVDFVYSESVNVSDSHWYTNTRWTSLSTDKSNYECKHISKLMNEYCKDAIPGGPNGGYDITSDAMIPVNIQTKELVGAKFQEWFLGRAGEGGGIFGDGGTFTGNGSVGGSGGSGGGSVNKDKQDNQDDEPYDIDAILDRLAQNQPEAAATISAHIDRGVTIYNNAYQYGHDKYVQNENNNYTYTLLLANSFYKRRYITIYNECIKLGFSEEHAKANVAGVAYKTLKNEIHTLGNSAAELTVFIIAESAAAGKTKIAKDMSLSTEEELLNTNIPLSNLEYLDNLDSNDNNSTLESLEYMGININTLSNILDIQIPLADETIEGEYKPAVKFISWESSPFNVKGFNQDLSGNHSVTLYDALKYKENGKFKYGIIVEPLMWAAMYQDSNTYENWYTYGTYYNILQYYTEQRAKSGGNGWDGRGCHYSYLKKHGKNCMAVSKTLDDFGTNTFQIKAATNSGQMELGEILNAIEGRKDGNIVSEKEGYGMHFYYGGDLETSSSTSTYDDPLGTTIAPAPDPSSLPPETSDYPTTSKQVTIIKNYVTREESIGTEVVDGNFIRQQNPHIIDIEDEPEYTVVQWETSTHLPPPSIQNGSTLETYDDLTVSSDSIQSGSSSENAVTLTDKEFILYVKLIFNL